MADPGRCVILHISRTSASGMRNNIILRLLNFGAFAVVFIGCIGAIITAAIHFSNDPAYAFGLAVGAAALGILLGMPYLTAGWALSEPSIKRRLTGTRWNMALLLTLAIILVFTLAVSKTLIFPSVVSLSIAVTIGILNIRALTSNRHKAAAVVSDKET